MNLPQPITKEDLDNLKHKYPKSMQVFLKWRTDFGFKVYEEYKLNYSHFASLPQPFQLGIWIEFLAQRNYFEIFNASDTLYEKMNNYFKYALEPSLSQLQS